MDNSDYTLHFAESEAEIEKFWLWRDKYMLEDVLPNATFRPTTDEEYEWFFSGEYKGHIMKLFHRTIDPLRIVFLQSGGENIGFAVYVIYHSEDGKCFIIDFCVNAEHRNKGIGLLFFSSLRDRAVSEGAVYFALNLSNEDNKRFWTRNGFVKETKDEYGNDIYAKRTL